MPKFEIHNVSFQQRQWWAIILQIIPAPNFETTLKIEMDISYVWNDLRPCLAMKLEWISNAENTDSSFLQINILTWFTKKKMLWCQPPCTFCCTARFKNLCFRSFVYFQARLQFPPFNVTKSTDTLNRQFQFFPIFLLNILLFFHEPWHPNKVSFTFHCNSCQLEPVSWSESWHTTIVVVTPVHWFGCSKQDRKRMSRYCTSGECLNWLRKTRERKSSNGIPSAAQTWAA